MCFQQNKDNYLQYKVTVVYDGQEDEDGNISHINL